MTKRKHSSIQPISFVLFITFVVLAIIIGYATIRNGGFELRSKASQEANIFTRWEFSKDTEGWSGKNLRSLSVVGGVLTAIVGEKQGNISTRLTDMELPKGNKLIWLRMAVGPNRVLTPEDRMKLQTFTFSLSYWAEGEKTGVPPAAKPLIVRGVADGVMHNYFLNIPKIDALKISRIWLGFYSGVSPGDVVKFDWIRLADVMPKDASEDTGSKSSSDGDNYLHSNPDSNVAPSLPSGTPSVPPWFYRYLPAQK